MSNLAKGDASWLRFIREMMFFVRLARKIEDDRRRCARERVQIQNVADFNANFTAATLSGVNFGTNTHENGLLYVRVTGGPTPYTVKLYKATGGGGGDEMATGTANASGTATMTAVNSSGLTGTITLAASVTTETDDVHALRPFPDWRLELLKLWPSDGTTNEDTGSRGVAQRLLDGLAALDARKIALVNQALSEWALSAPNNPIARGNKYLQSSESTLLSETAQQDSSGNVSRLRSGFFQRLLETMRDEATGAEQDIVTRVVAAAAGTFDSANNGLGAVAAVAVNENHTPVGRWDFKCVQGQGNGRGGTEEFDGAFTSTVAGDDTTFTFRQLRVKQSWKGPLGLGPITLNRTHTKTGDGSNTEFGVAGIPGTTTFSTTGENETNTDGGVLYWTTTADTPSTNLTQFEFFKSSNRATGDLVAKATSVADAATSVTASAQNGSGLTVVFNAGSDPAGTTGTLDLNFFHIDNGSSGSAATPDKFSIVTSLTSTGNIARVLAEVLKVYMNSDTSGSEQLSDNLVLPNTFPPYITADI